MTEDETDALVTVIAEYQAHAGRGDEVATILARHVAATRAEPGCVNFTAYRDPADPDHFALHEEYTDENAFQAHRKTPHFVACVEEQIVPLLLDRSWRRYHEVPAVRAVADSVSGRGFLPLPRVGLDTRLGAAGVWPRVP
jgi:quinol monooxygenase YgiN